MPKRSRGELREAIRVFAEHGYEGTSIDDLTAAMEIGRQSLYNKFGDKRRLYLTALQQYIDDQIEFMLGILQQPLSPSGRITALFDACVASLISEDSLPCLFTSAITEFGSTDKEVLRLTKRANMTLAKALGRCIADGQARGEIPRGHDPVTLANFLIWSMAGIRMAGRFSAGAPTLQGLADIALGTVHSNEHPVSPSVGLEQTSARYK
jgi:AcrR family transcriptional regulator